MLLEQSMVKASLFSGHAASDVIPSYRHSLILAMQHLMRSFEDTALLTCKEKVVKFVHIDAW